MLEYAAVAELGDELRGKLVGRHPCDRDGVVQQRVVERAAREHRVERGLPRVFVVEQAYVENVARADAVD